MLYLFIYIQMLSNSSFRRKRMVSWYELKPRRWSYHGLYNWMG